ncbi:MAG: IPT/TIG domain-containing protein, partial [Bradymonadia bacterium]
MKIRYLIPTLVLLLAACGDSDTGSGEEDGPNIEINGDLGTAETTDASPDLDSEVILSGDAGVDVMVDMAPPSQLSINSLVPNRGSIEGGTQVRIVGDGFTEQTRFDFGSEPCAELTIENPNRAICIIPPGTDIGVVDVSATRVFNSERSTVVVPEGFTYFTPLTITMVSPERMNSAGGLPINVYGTGFVEGTEVRIDNQRIATVDIRSSTELSFMAPAHDAGQVPLLLRNVDGSVETSIVYYDTLKIDSLSPGIGLVTGGEEVIISGHGLKTSRLAPAVVTFAGETAEVLEGSTDSTQLRVLTPSVEAAGLVDVTVSTGVVETTAENAFLYYEVQGSDFDVFGVAPDRGNVLGGDLIDIAGQGFTEDAFVLIDGTPAIDCLTISVNRISCATPIGREGQVDVEVVQDGLPITLPLAFTYFRAISLVSVDPVRGAICGGAQVLARGT